MIITWVFIALIVAGGLLLFRVEHLGKKVKLVILIFLAFLLYLSVVTVFSGDNFDLTSPQGIVKGVYAYVGWMGDTASNLFDVGKQTVVLVGDAIKINSTDEGDGRR